MSVPVKSTPPRRLVYGPGNTAAAPAAAAGGGGGGGGGGTAGAGAAAAAEASEQTRDVSLTDNVYHHQKLKTTNEQRPGARAEDEPPASAGLQRTSPGEAIGTVDGEGYGSRGGKEGGGGTAEGVREATGRRRRCSGGKARRARKTGMVLHLCSRDYFVFSG